jgi:hypothetical protein
MGVAVAVEPGPAVVVSILPSSGSMIPKVSHEIQYSPSNSLVQPPFTDKLVEGNVPGQTHIDEQDVSAHHLRKTKHGDKTFDLSGGTRSGQLTKLWCVWKHPVKHCAPWSKKRNGLGKAISKNK